jgi:hypothetical protein
LVAYLAGKELLSTGRLWISGRNKHRPLIHNLDYDDERRCSSSAVGTLGGLIQTADGSEAGIEGPFTKRSGFFR